MHKIDPPYLNNLPSEIVTAIRRLNEAAQHLLDTMGDSRDNTDIGNDFYTRKYLTAMNIAMPFGDLSPSHRVPVPAWNPMSDLDPK